MRSTRTRRGQRSTSTGCWRSASPPRRPPSSGTVTAVIAAAGSGERLGAGGPKALVPLADRPLAEWSLRACREAESVGPIVLAAPSGREAEFSELIAAAGGDREASVSVVAGGESRSQSVANALAAVETELVAVHDAARPLLTSALLDDVVALLQSDPEADAAIAAAPVADTIKRAAPAHRSQDFPGHGKEKVDRAVLETLERDGLWGVQTPQVFRTDALRRAIEVAGPEGLESATDDATLIERAGGRVLIHPSPPSNLKVTTPTDLRLAELLLDERG